MTPFALGSAAAAAIGGRIVNRYGRPLVVDRPGPGRGRPARHPDLALHFVPGRGAGWAAALPLLVAGIGSGLVISPNQTLTLAEVPVERAGSAGAVLQTGQRIGTAVGIAAVGARVLRPARRPAAAAGCLAFRTALMVTVGFVLIALAAALGDLRARVPEPSAA